MNKKNGSDKLKIFFYNCLLYWKFIFIFLGISLLIAFFYNRYATRIYQSNVTILINDYKKAGFNSEITAFSDKFSLYNQNKVGMENEMEFLKSRENIFEVVKNLDLNIFYYSDGKFKSEDLYGKTPIFIKTKDTITSFLSFTIEFLNDNNIKVLDKNSNVLFNGLISNDFRLNNNTFYFKKNSNFKNSSLDKVFVKIFPVNSIVESFKARTLTTNLNDETSVIDVSVSDNSIARSIDYLNSLVQVYERNTILDKEKQIRKTYDFVLNRLDAVDKELTSTEISDQDYKIQNNIVSTDMESGISLSSKEDFLNRIKENNVIIDIVNKEIQKSKTEDLVLMSSTVMPTNQILINQINEYNKNITDFFNSSKGSSKKHPDYIKETLNLKNQRTTIISGLENFKRQLISDNFSFQSKLSLINNKIFNLPTQSNNVSRSTRKINIISDNYKYLMNKKEETAISLYSVAPNSKVIEKPFSTGSPIYPSTKIIYFAAFLIGLLIPLALIYLKLIFNNKINSKEDIQDNSELSFMGEIVKSDVPLIGINDRSSTAESFRIVRANIDFVLQTKNSLIEKSAKAKRIFITSSIPKEGKTFVAVNLALSFAQTGKKVLLIGLDIRNPKINSYLELKKSKFGLTNFLVSDENESAISNYIEKFADNFYVLPSGIIPPNPSELLITEKLGSLFEFLDTQYDYIIVDTAPVTLVSDTFLIAKHSDIFVFVLRHRYSDVKFIGDIENLQNQGKIININLLLNDVDFGKTYGYNYGYRYGYGNEQKKDNFFITILKKIGIYV
jgi:tyrosine-protein kinase Etk/Wzc